MTKTLKLTAIPALTAIMLMGGALAGYASIASAQTSTTDTSSTKTMPAKGLREGIRHSFGRGMHGKGPGVVGTVSAVNGSTITVTGKDGVSYTVNAGSASVKKVITGTLSDVVIGDTIGVQGTVSGTSVTATTIMDGIPPMHAPTQ